MNRLGTLLGAAALVWCAVLTWQVAQNPASKLPDALKSGEAAKVAYVHGDSLQLEYKYIRVLEGQIMNTSERLQLQMDSIVRPWREEAQELIDYANSGEATDEEINVASQRLGEIEQAVKQLQTREQQIMGNLERQMQSQIAERLQGELEAYAAETGIDVIVNWGLSGEGVLYGNDGFNITRPLIDYLNERVEQPALQADTTATVAAP
jgi:hypothetical protein